MAITLSTLSEGDVYGVRSALPAGFSAGSVGEYLDTLNVDLKIWIGDQTTAKPSTATYSFTLDTTLFGSTLQYYELDIAELVREYIDTDNFSYPSTYESDWSSWVEIDWDATNDSSGSFSGTIEFMCTNGYRIYENSTLALPAYYCPSDLYIPANQPYYLTALDLEAAGGTRTIDQLSVEYNDGSDSTVSFGTAGTTTSSLFKVLAVSFPSGATSAVITGSLSAAEVFTINAYKVCKEKYDVKQIGYVNRIGVVDYIYGFGRNDEAQQVSRNIYKPALNNNYDNANAQYRILNANGKRTLTINTDWVKEEYREKISDLILTEYAFLGTGLAEEGDVKAINPTDAEQVLKQDNNELSNYTLSFEYAYDHINSVR